MLSSPSTSEPSTDAQCCMRKSHCVFTTLAIINVGYMLMRYFNVSILGMIINMIFYQSLLYMGVNKICSGKCCDTLCGNAHMKKLDKIDERLHQTINDYLNKLRRITLLKDMGSFSRTMGALFFIIIFLGSCTTTFGIVFCLDVYLLMQIGDIKEYIKKATDFIVGITGRIIYDIIPKYKEPEPVETSQ